MHAMTPSEIVSELDKYIVGQAEAKRKVAIALRNRWRRKQLADDLRDEVAPKNIIMIGPTGVGKTEIARRLAKLADAPFIKVEASKFTEVGYVGRDCESMIRDLVEVGIRLVRDELEQSSRAQAATNAEKRLMDLLLPPQPQRGPERVFRPYDPASPDEGPARNLVAEEDPEARAREVLWEKLSSGALDEREVELEVREQNRTQMMQVFSNAGIEEMGVNLQELFGKMGGEKKKRKKVTVGEAREILTKEELANLIEMDMVTKLALERVQDSGIVFLDEIDKIAGRGNPSSGPDVSREGVQRDILPIVEGSTVITKYGPVKTDHILFIAAGAFHVSKVSDLIPELQGRFPIRVELESLRAEDFRRILMEPENSLVRQYAALLATESVTVTFSTGAIELIATYCEKVNQDTENIGARRLHTLMEYLLEDISFHADKKQGATLHIDADYVRERLDNLVERRDMSQYIL
jgi:ATP-dependent HslUV protease ATP-binding subunit HslU